ncbi:MAG: peptide chain release factor-like protein [Phycisphaerales bacterium]
MPAERWHHPACLDDDELLKQCDVGRGRSSGPGGQNRNKVETLVYMTHVPSGVEAHAGERRSQIENKRVALRRLRLALATEVRTGVPIGLIGSALWRSRASGGKIACSPGHHDYPALLAEVMDVVADAGWDLRKPALRLEVSSSQLLKLIKDHPPALVVLNQERQKRGLHPMK